MKEDPCNGACLRHSLPHPLCVVCEDDGQPIPYTLTDRSWLTEPLPAPPPHHPDCPCVDCKLTKLRADFRAGLQLGQLLRAGSLASPDVECTSCGVRYYSGEGHATLALCRTCARGGRR